MNDVLREDDAATWRQRIRVYGVRLIGYTRRWKSGAAVIVATTVAVAVAGTALGLVLAKTNRIGRDERKTHDLALANQVLARQAKMLSADTRRLTLANRRLTVQIQQSRLRITRENCENQNKHHLDATHALDQLLAATGNIGQQAERGRKNTEHLIDAITPQQDCNAVVKRAQTHG